MSGNAADDRNDLLERALTELRATPVPTGPSPEVVSRTLVAVKYAAHGNHRVSKVVIPKITGMRLVHLSVDGPEAWCIRDYITGRMLRSGNSEKTAGDIEAEVTDYFIPKIKRSVGRVADWKAELEKESNERFGEQVDLNSEPNPTWGRWKQLR